MGEEKLFRPPYGAHNETVDSIVAELGYRLCSWNVDTLDWNARYQPDKWVQHGMDRIRTGDTSIVLTHDIHQSTADHIDCFISRLKALGDVTFAAGVGV
jgi:peptidoglycan/xylan/chitin deacetylase (PgdA/CDA1 family)